MSRIDELIAELAPQGVKFKTLGDIADLVRGNGMPKVDLTGEGVGAIHYGQIYTRYGVWTTETLSFVAPETAAKLAKAEPGDIIITNTSENIEDVCKAVAWLGDETIVTGGHATVIKHHEDSKYLSYWFQSESFASQKKALATGTKVIDVSAKQLMKVRIPVPPLEVQREIVRILDQFTQLEAELEAELEARRHQYANYQRSLLSFPEGRATWMTLGDIGKVSMCKRVFKNETTADGDIPFFKIGTFGGKPDAYINQALYEDYKSRFSFPKAGDVLISAAGTIGRAIPYDGAPAYFQDSNIVWIDNDESVVLNSYLLHWYRVIEWATDGATIRRLYNGNIRRARIPVPSIAEQGRIVGLLSSFDALVNDLNIGLPAELEARRKQYEYYRDRLLTFEEVLA
jgi:type I restriction enzyme S subunit